MQLLPDLQVGIWNGWIPLVLYFVGLLISISRFSKESRTWLFNNPQDTSRWGLKALRLFGQGLAVASIGMMIFTPLKLGAPVLLLGVVIYLSGYALVISALHAFRKTPLSTPVSAGPYRFSRNPQWLGLLLVLCGSAIAVGIWLYLGMLAIVSVIYHIQILDEETACLEKYGDGYRQVMGRVPRYFLFL
jgi:protein-S-isoprenylcysteine O-methyltransferase Ste14